MSEIVQNSILDSNKWPKERIKQVRDNANAGFVNQYSMLDALTEIERSHARIYYLEALVEKMNGDKTAPIQPNLPLENFKDFE